MNAPAHLLVNARHGRLAARLLACVGACALLGGCIGNPLKEAKVDPASPVAADVTKLAHSNPDYPSFREIPPKPTDVRPARLYGEEAKATEQARDQLVAATAPSTWTLSNTEGFAAAAQRDAGPTLATPNPQDTEAYANALRKRATPPPPPKR